MVECETVQDEKCEDVTQGYTTEQKCTKWPREVCTKETKRTLKYSPETDCKKVPRDLCGPSGCILQPGPEECFDKKETVITEACAIIIKSAFPQYFQKYWYNNFFVYYRSPKKLAIWSPRNLVNTSPSWFPCWNPEKNVWIFQKKFAQEHVPIPAKSRNPWWKNGAMYPPNNQAWTNQKRFLFAYYLVNFLGFNLWICGSDLMQAVIREQVQMQTFIHSFFLF